MDSLRTRINGFTAWVNLRLAPSGVFSNNILEDLLKGKNMKILLESMTGKPFKKLQSFDGLTQQQKITRVEWMLKELMDRKIVQRPLNIDTQMFAMRSSTQVFELLWCLVCHDIWYVWNKSFLLQHADSKEMVAEPFSWIPTEAVDEKDPENADEISEVSSTRDGSAEQKYPEPDICILDMVNAHLKTTREGRALTRGVMTLDDLTDSRVLCALFNSFVPETFTTEVLLNDRWTINLVLQTANEMFQSTSPFDATDICQGDIMSVCSYFAFFFMCGYKMKQCRTALKRLDDLMLFRVGAKHELENLEKDSNLKQDLERRIREYEVEINFLEASYDIAHCTAWMKSITSIQKKVRTIVARRMKNKFEIVRVPGNMTINDLTVSLLINLSLTSGIGFYHIKGREMLSKDKKIVIQKNETGEFFDGLHPLSEGTIRKLLGLQADEVVEVNPDSHPEYKIFVGSSSRNKVLKGGSLFLYQVFPGDTSSCQRLLFKAARTAELDTVQKLITFFQSDRSFIDSSEPGSGNTALHMACRLGHLEIVQYLLEKGANINCASFTNCTPLFAAVGGKQKEIAELLIEWGADITLKNKGGKTAMEIIQNDDFRKTLCAKQKFVGNLVTKVTEGDINVLDDVIQAHCQGGQVFRSLRSRCIRGSTLLHTAALFGKTLLVKTLLQERVPVNLLDYKGATALHRVKDPETLQVLLEAGGNLDIVDADGNSPLHVICYGTDGEATNIDCLKIQVKRGPSMNITNKKGMLPIHCAAIQGRQDAIELLLNHDAQQSMRDQLSFERQIAPSPVYLSIANDNLQCAFWLCQNKLHFFPDEPDELLEKILLAEIPCSEPLFTAKFLLDNGASVNCTYAEGNTALHYAAAKEDMSEVLTILLQCGADPDFVNKEMFSPLFFATQNCCIYNASILIKNGANVKIRNFQGLTAFDFVTDFDEWINCGFFDEETQARLKAYSLKHSRDLVKAITKKVKAMNTSRVCQDKAPSKSKYKKELELNTLIQEIT